MQECPKADAATDHEECGSTEKYLFAPAFNCGATGFGRLFELLGQLCVANVVVVETNEIQLYSMFDLHLAKLMKVIAPAGVLRQILSDALGKENVASITAIHYPLS